MDNPYPWLHDFIEQIPEILQPLMVAALAAIPYVEGEGAVTLGIIAGIDPIVAAVAAVAGNVLCVVAVVLLGSRIRGGIIDRRSARTAASAPEAAPGLVVSPVATATATVEQGDGPDDETESSRRSKGRTKLRRWLVRFGLPGASLLAPIALPTMLTAAFFVATGARKEWVILWQVIAIVLWTGAVAVVATGVLALLGW